LVSFSFAVLLLTVPPSPAICKSGGTCPPVPHGVGDTVYKDGKHDRLLESTFSAINITVTQVMG